MIGSSLNAGFISGSPRYNYGKDSYKIPTAYIEKRRKLREVAGNYGVDLRTAALALAGFLLFRGAIAIAVFCRA